MTASSYDGRKPEPPYHTDSDIVVEAFAPPRGVSSRTVIITKNGSTEAFEIATTRYSEVKVLQ